MNKKMTIDCVVIILILVIVALICGICFTIANENNVVSNLEASVNTMIGNTENNIANDSKINKICTTEIPKLTEEDEQTL